MQKAILEKGRLRHTSVLLELARYRKKKILTAFDRHVAPDIRRLAEKVWMTPHVLMRHVKNLLTRDTCLSHYKEVIVSGETDNISIYLIGKQDIILYTPFKNAQNNVILVEIAPKLLIKYSDQIYLIEKNKEIIQRLSLPKVILINPSVKSVFPTPRFALCVASLAAYLRKYQKAEVYILDMQVGLTIETIIEQIKKLQPDIIGISISFGQIILATSIIKRMFSDQEIMAKKPLIVAGNVISAFGYKELIRTFPNLIVCNGEGELTMIGLVDYVKGKINIESVPGITFFKDGAFKRTQSIEVNMNDIPLPAMDTAEGIINENGAFTMEICRGCYYSACSFCPRTHKPRKWKGMPAKNVLKQLEYYKRIFDNFGIRRRIYMADEEFIGWMENHEEAKRITDIMKGMIHRGYNIHFETSTRVDQIYNSRKDVSWHIEQMRMLTLCKKAGLDRLLVGIESGSDSVLKRFNKGIRSQDSVMAIRILTALGIGLRATFIMFDPLMSFSELKENLAFLERRNAYLRPINLSEISYSELFEGIHQDDFVKDNSMNTPLYGHISYMLVSLEVLMNCDYIRLMEHAEIEYGKRFLLNDRKPDINMARYKVAYLDERIGDISIFCQRWIDRHFVLDYCLKGMYKTAVATERQAIFGYRAKYRELSFHLLKSLVWIFDEENTTKISGNIVSENELIPLREKVRVENRNHIIMATLELFNEKMRLVVDEIEKAVNAGRITDDNDDLKKVIDQWRKKSDWSLINPFSTLGR